MSLHDGLTPKMKPISPRRSAIVAALDIGTSKVVCLIARLRPQTPSDVLRRRSHAIEVIGIGHCEARGMKGGAVVNLAEVEESVQALALNAHLLLGLRDFSRTDAIVAVEWGDAVEASLPADHLTVEIAVGDGEERRILLRAPDRPWDARLDALRGTTARWRAA